jgi:type II secretory pathway pseudopilin PulG
MMALKNEDGFTYLEIILSLLIVTVTLIPILNMFSGGQERYHRSTDNTIAINLAQKKMEEIVGSNLDTFQENPDTWLEFSDYPGYYYQVDIIPPEAGSSLPKDKLNLYEIHVKVQYQVSGKTQSIEISTYSAKK